MPEIEGVSALEKVKLQEPSHTDSSTILVATVKVCGPIPIAVVLGLVLQVI